MDSANRGLDLETELTCSICTEVLYQPLTLLDCLHTFCGACLKEWFTIQLSQARSSPSQSNSFPFTCPSCRAPVRETKHNATVSTLLDMFLAANPAKARTDKEKEESSKKYKPGEDVIPVVEEKEKTLRERRIDDEDRRLVDEVREASLLDVSNEGRGSRQRREVESSRGSAPRSSRNNSREQRSTDARERRRRADGDSEGERRSRREEANSSTLHPDTASLRPDVDPTTDRRRRRSDEDSRRRQERTNRTDARQIEHQSSLRSLISTSDLDSREMEEEILRQIQEEGLLDGIDVENIDIDQRDQISERIAEAFRRRQRERSQVEPSRRNEPNPGSQSGNVVEPASRDNAVPSENLRPSAQWREHSRSGSASSHADEVRSNPRTGSSLEVMPGDESRRRRRTNSGNRASNSSNFAQPSSSSRPAARSQTDLSDRPRSSQNPSTRPNNSAQGRSTTDPLPPRPAESTLVEPDIGSDLQPLLPRARTLMRTEDVTVPVELPTRTLRAPPPAEISVPTPSNSSVTQHDPPHSSAPLSPRNQLQTSASERANAWSSANRPLSSSSTLSWRNSMPRFPEPSLSCAVCGKPHIEYDLHYNCHICNNGDWNICLHCYRSGKGCRNWFGFGYTAWAKWDRLISSGELLRDAERPHMLTANRYIPPKIIAGGADGRRTITADDPQKRLQSGAFCSNCLVWANECFWRCDLCNAGDWGFCNNCVNQGKCCTHQLLPLKYLPSSTSTPPLSPAYDHPTPLSATLLTGADVVEFGSFKPLTFRNQCEICHYSILPGLNRYHCFSCTSSQPNRQPGDYDICIPCYTNLEVKKRISAENGQNGWRRCLQGHRMIILSFQDARGGQRRIIEHDLVGGTGLHEEPLKSPDHSGLNLQQWSWAAGSQIRLVTADVAGTAPATSTSLAISNRFPSEGGSGIRVLARWGWYPKDVEGENELLFPGGAEIRECVDVNGHWFYGAYMGATGLFPAAYIRVLDAGPT